jgi:hypothetical protein
MKTATGKSKSRLSSAVWMLLTIGVISFVLYKAGQSVTETGAAQEPVVQQPGNAPCGVSSFAVDKLRARGVHITGRLLNNCDLAAGAQVKITTYDKAGSILSVDDIWPASISNIPAHSTFPFEWLMTGASGVDTFTVAVTSVKTWTGAK